MRYGVYEGPLGRLILIGDARGLQAIRFAAAVGESAQVEPDWQADRNLFASAFGQLDGYFAGTRTRFDLPLVLTGTPFQQQVMRALQAIPYGRTCSYGDLARQLGRPGAARAVGAANRRNPLPVVIPCHRVIGADGTLTGYAGGLSLKRALLEIEGIYL